MNHSSNIAVTADGQSGIGHSRTSTIVRLSFVIGVVLIASAMILTVSRAAFSDTTSNATNNWAAGDVVITDELSSAMFSIGNMKPGVAAIKCIVVTYEGSLLNADVSLYGTSVGTLDTYLDLTIDRGSTGSFSDCGAFSGTQVYTGTLADFSTNRTNFGNGVTGWSPASTPESQTFRFTLTVQNDDLAQGLSTAGTFTWEAQNQ